MVCSIDTVRAFYKVIYKEIISGQHRSFEDLFKKLNKFLSDNNIAEADRYSLLQLVPSFTTVSFGKFKEVRDVVNKYTDYKTLLDLVDQVNDVNFLKDLLREPANISEWHSNNQTVSLLKKEIRNNGFAFGNRGIVVNRKISPTKAPNLPEGYVDDSELFYDEVVLVKINNMYYEIAIRRQPLKGKKDFIPFKTAYSEKDLDAYKGDKRIVNVPEVDAKTIEYRYEYNNLTDIAGLHTRALKAFTDLYSSANVSVSSISFEHFAVATDKALEETSKRFIGLPKLKPYIKDDDGNFTADVGTLALEPGSPFVVVAVNLYNRHTNQKSTVYQVIKLVGKKIQETDTIVTELRSFLTDLNTLEQLYNKLGFPDLKYGNEDITTQELYDSDNVNFYWHSLFIGFLGANPKSNFVMPFYQKLKKAIDEAPNKDTIYEQIAKVNNHILTAENSNPILSEHKVLDTKNQHVALEGTQVEILKKAKVKKLLKEQTVDGIDIYDYFTKLGYVFVYSSTSGGMLEARKSMELTGKDATGGPNYVHALLSYSFNFSFSQETGRRFFLETNSQGEIIQSPEIEFFKLTKEDVLNNKPRRVRSSKENPNRIAINIRNTAIPIKTTDSAPMLESLAIELITTNIKTTKGKTQIALDDLVRANNKIKLGNKPGHFSLSKNKNKIDEESSAKHVKRVAISLKSQVPFISLQEGETDVINLREALQFLVDPSNFENGESTHNPTNQGSFGLRAFIPAWDITYLDKKSITEDGNLKEGVDSTVYNNLRSGFTTIRPTSVVIEETGAYATSKSSKKEASDSFADQSIDNINPDEEFDEDVPKDEAYFSNNAPIDVLGYLPTVEDAFLELQKLMPDITLDDFKTHVNTLFVNGITSKNFGAYFDGVINLLTNESGISKVVLRHEAFHRIIDMYLPPAVRSKLLRLAKRELQKQGFMHPSLTQVEEYLAELFQIHRTTPVAETNVFKRFFKQLLAFLKEHVSFLFKNETVIKQFLDNINNGQYSLKLRDPSKKGDVKWMKNVEQHFMANRIEAETRHIEALKVFKTIAADSVNNPELFIGDLLMLLGNRSFLGKYLDKAPKNIKTLLNETKLELHNAYKAGNLTNDYFRATTAKLIAELRNLNYGEYGTAFFLHQKSLYETVIFGPNKKLGSETVKELIIDIFGDYNVKSSLGTYASVEELVNELDEITNKEDEEVELEKLNNNDQIISAKQINTEETLTKLLRARFKLIRNEVYDTFVLDKVAFRKISTDLLNADPNNFTANINSLLKGLPKDSDAAAIYSMLLENIRKGEASLPKIPGFPSNIIEYKDSKIYFFTKEVRINYKNISIENTMINEYSKNIYNLITTKYPELKSYFTSVEKVKEYLVAVKTKQEASEFITRVTHEILSQSTTTPVASLYNKGVVQRFDYENEEVTQKQEYTYAPKVLSAYTYSAQIKSKIVNYIQNKLSQELSVAKMNSVHAMVKKLDANQVMRILGLGSLIKDGLTDSQKNEFKVNFLKVLESVIENLPKELKNKEFAISSIDTKSDLFNHSALERAVDILYTSSEQLTALMYRDEKNNLRFSQTIGSFVFDVLNGVSLDHVNAEIPNFLTVANWNNSNNFFLNIGEGSIFRTVDFDYLKNLENSDDAYSATGYDRMSPAQFYIHRFLAQFAGRLSQSVSTTRNGEFKQALKYNQYLYIQSNRPSDTGAEIKLLGAESHTTSKTLSLQEGYNAAKKLEDAFYNDKTKEKLKGFDPTNRRFNQTYQQFLKQQSRAIADAYTHMLEEFQQFYYLNPFNNPKQTEDSDIEMGIPSIRTIFKKNGLYDFLYNNNLLLNTNNIAYYEKQVTGKVPDKFIYDAARLMQVFELFYLNNYINGFNLNTLVFGSSFLTKDVETLIKRMQGIKSPGKKQSINPTGFIELNTLGNKKFSNVAVLEDVERYYDEISQGAALISGINKTSAKVFDGATIGTPSTLRNIQRGTGDYNLTDIIKIVSFQHNPKGVTVYLKTALFVITDPLARMFPKLAELRKEMESKGMNETMRNRHAKLYAKLLENTISDQEQLEYQNLVDLNPNQIDYVAFDSAIKVGRNKEISKQGEALNSNSVVQVYNEFIRIQSNPYHDEGSVSNFSQFNYFIPSNQLNDREALAVYEIDALLTNLGLEQMSKLQGLFTLEANGSVSNINTKKIKDALLASLEKAKDTDPKPYRLLKDNVDFTFPSLQTKGIITLANIINKATVEIRHSGNKLNAQPSFGVELYEIPGQGPVTYYGLSKEVKLLSDAFHKLPYRVQELLTTLNTQVYQGREIEEILTNKTNIYDLAKLTEEERTIADKYITLNSSEIIIPRRLQFRDKDGYTEVIAPKWWLDQNGFIEGDIFIGDESEAFKKLYTEGLGVRIPTTGIHSALAIKIIAGASRDPITNKQVNRIIVPEEIVAIHGSDFDIDALFVIRREIFPGVKLITRDGETVKVPSQEIQELKKLGVYAKESLPVGYDEKGRLDQNFYDTLEAAKQNLKLDINDPTDVQKEQIKKDKDTYKFILKYQRKFLINKKFNIYISIITAEKNKDSATTPIEFGYIKRDFTEDLEERTFESQEELNNSLNKSGIFKDLLPDDFTLDYKDVNKNKLKLSKELEEKLLNHPDVGVKLKLKIIVGNISLKDQRDPNNIKHASLFHKDNFEGALGIGITANFMKQLAYRMFSTPLTLGEVKVNLNQIKSFEYITVPSIKKVVTEFETSDSLSEYEAKIVYLDEEGNEVTYSGSVQHESVKLSEPIEFLKTNLSELRYTTFIHGHKVFDLLDTMVNGYIDNVKEQITWIMNSTGATIDIINTMLALGLDLSTIAIIMNQPILKEGAKVNNGVVRRIETQIKTLLGKNLTDYKNAAPPTMEDIIKVLKITYGMSLADLKTYIDKNSTNSTLVKKVQYYVGIALFPKLKDLAEGLASDARNLSILRNLPVLPNKILSTNMNLAKTHDLFVNDDLSQIPSIKAALNALNVLNNLLAQLYPSMSAKRRSNITKLQELILDFGKNNNYIRETKSIEFFNNALDNIPISLVIDEYKNKFPEIFTTGDYIGIDELTSKLVTKLSNDKYAVKFKGFGNVKDIVFDSNRVLPLNDQELLLQVLLHDIKDQTTYIEFQESTTINGVKYPKGHPIGMQNTKKGLEKSLMLPIDQIPQEYLEAYNHNVRANELSLNRFLSLVDIRIKKDGSGLEYLFTLGAKSNEEQDNLIAQAASTLPDDVKFKLLMIDLIQNRASFGFKGYTNYLDSKGGAYPGLTKLSIRLRQLKKAYEENALKDYSVLNYLLLASNKNNLKLFTTTKSKLKADEFRVLAKEFNIDENSNMYEVIEVAGTPVPVYRSFTIIEKEDGTKIKINQAAVLLETINYQGKEYALYVKIPESKSDKYVMPSLGGKTLLNNYELIPILKQQRYTKSISQDSIVEFTEKGVFTKSFEIKLDADENKNIETIQNFERFNNMPVVLRDYNTNIGGAFRAILNTKIERNNQTLKVTQTFSKPTSGAKFQIKAEQAAGVSTIKKIVGKLQKLYKVKVEYDTTMLTPGRFENGTVYINPELAGKDTPIHEFLHPIIMGLKKADPGLYESLLAEIETIYPDLRSNIESIYTQDINEEILVTGLTRLISEKGLSKIQKLVNRLVNFIKGLLGIKKPIDLSSKMSTLIDEFLDGKLNYLLEQSINTENPISNALSEELREYAENPAITEEEFRSLVDHLKNC